MAEKDESTSTDKATSIDYSKSQVDVDKAKQKARDDDAKRLAQEHE